MKIRLLSCLLLLTMLCCSCGIPLKETPEQVSETVVNQGDVFLSSGFKIRAVMTPQNQLTLNQAVFEVYLDSKGNGQGLFGYEDFVYDVIIVSDKIYVKITDTVIVNVSDFTGHMIPVSLEVKGVEDISLLGFTLYEGSAIAYGGTENDMVIDCSYQANETMYESATISTDNSMSLDDLITYILNRSSTAYTDQPIDDGSAEEVERNSFYNSSIVGVSIHGTVYSIGDYCNTSTYFEGVVPEGVVPTYVKSADNTVEMLHVSYISSDGRSEFVTTDGYVQSIYTTSDFSFLKIYKGMSTTEAEQLLGIKLKKDEEAVFQPMIEGLTAVKGTKAYVLYYNNLTITLATNSKTKTVESIMVENYLDFLEEG